MLTDALLKRDEVPGKLVDIYSLLFSVLRCLFVQQYMYNCIYTIPTTYPIIIIIVIIIISTYTCTRDCHARAVNLNPFPGIW